MKKLKHLEVRFKTEASEDDISEFLTGKAELTNKIKFNPLLLVFTKYIQRNDDRYKFHSGERRYTKGNQDYARRESLLLKY